MLYKSTVRISVVPIMSLDQSELALIGKAWEISLNVQSPYELPRNWEYFLTLTSVSVQQDEINLNLKWHNIVCAFCFCRFLPYCTEYVNHFCHARWQIHTDIGDWNGREGNREYARFSFQRIRYLLPYFHGSNQVTSLNSIQIVRIDHIGLIITRVY